MTDYGRYCVSALLTEELDAAQTVVVHDCGWTYTTEQTLVLASLLEIVTQHNPLCSKNR